MDVPVTRAATPVRRARSGAAPTISDVAARAGVSSMTVSRVINGETSVRPATRQAVTAAIAALDHAPNPAARSLAGAGQLRIGLLYANPSAGFLNDFLLGSLEQASRSDVQIVVRKCDPGDHGLEAAERLLGLADPPTAIFSSNDDMAAAAVAVAHRLGLDVPGDLTVCRFDDTALATAIWPELTTVRQPITHMARAAIEMLVSAARRARRGSGVEPPRLLDRALVRRRSDAAPRQRALAVPPPG